MHLSILQLSSSTIQVYLVLRAHPAATAKPIIIALSHYNDIINGITTYFIQQKRTIIDDDLDDDVAP